MNIRINYKVTSCASCPFLDKTSSDDPFSDSCVRFYCGKNYDLTITNRREINNRCPIKANKCHSLKYNDLENVYESTTKNYTRRSNEK